MDKTIISDINELQIAITHLENTVERLDNIIAKQDKQLLDMQRQLQLIYAQSVDRKEQQAAYDGFIERPPHY